MNSYEKSEVYDEKSSAFAERRTSIYYFPLKTGLAGLKVYEYTKYRGIVLHDLLGASWRSGNSFLYISTEKHAQKMSDGAFRSLKK
jgi:hypothetical protein